MYYLQCNVVNTDNSSLSMLVSSFLVRLSTIISVGFVKNVISYGKQFHTKVIVAVLLLPCRRDSDSDRRSLCEDDQSVLENMLEKSYGRSERKYMLSKCVDNVSNIAEWVGSSMSRKWYAIIEL